MKKIEKKKITTNCECSEDCSYNQFSISQQENIIFERSAPRVFSEPWLGIIGDTQYGHFGTNAMDGLDFDETYWFNMGNENKICLHSPDVPNIYSKYNPLSAYVVQENTSRMLTGWCCPRTRCWITSSPGPSRSGVTAAASGRRWRRTSRRTRTSWRGTAMLRDTSSPWPLSTLRLA